MPSLDRYLAEASELTASIAGLSRDDLLAFPVPNTWSIQQIVLHLVDTDLVISDRMKRVIAEDNPTLLGFDQNKFAERLHYDQQDAQLAAEFFAKNRQLMATVLRALTDADYNRVGTHNQRGPMSLADLLTFASTHFQHHLKFLREKRDLLTNRKPSK